ncbi:unannotated protein [freshwater metagenome]|uniref:Unannotated protein n=1 Tax=freshwater metagenome TaxID=449393 RepID=A0A6J7BC52_9ZZZZ
MAKPSACNLAKSLFIKGNTRTQSTHSKRWSNNDRIVKLSNRTEYIIHRVTDNASRRLPTNFFDYRSEEFAIFATFYCCNISTNELYSITIESPGLKETNCSIERRLTSKSSENSIWPFSRNDAFDKFGGYRFDIRCICKFWVSHNGRRI